jgi:hypothetical protein
VPTTNQKRHFHCVVCGEPLGRRKGPFCGLSCRFNSKVTTGDGCWLWNGARDGKGYGRLIIKDVNARATRVAWELAYGEIPSGLYVCHRCDTPSCVRPDHLFLATNDENMADMVAKGRARNGTTAQRVSP